jgi:hypothetical protein
MWNFSGRKRAPTDTDRNAVRLSGGRRSSYLPQAAHKETVKASMTADVRMWRLGAFVQPLWPGKKRKKEKKKKKKKKKN